MKKIFLYLSLILTFSLTSFSDVSSIININKFKEIGYDFFGSQEENFLMIRKIKEGKNSKIVAFWQNENLTTQNIVDTLKVEQSNSFNVIKNYSIDNIKVTKYTLKNNKEVFLYDVVFKYSKIKNLFISISYIGKATLTDKEVKELVEEAKSFIK